MPTLTVRNLDDETRDALKALGARHGRSMEAEARVILAAAVRAKPVVAGEPLGSRIRNRFAGLDYKPGTRRAELPRPATFDA